MLDDKNRRMLELIAEIRNAMTPASILCQELAGDLRSVTLTADAEVATARLRHAVALLRELQERLSDRD